MTIDLLDRALTDKLQSQSHLAFEAECRQRVAESEARRAANRKPDGWQIPPYQTRDFWIAVAHGWISEEQAEAISTAHLERVARAEASLGKVGRYPTRWERETPRESRQYANQIATTASRDRRLVPEAKALLTILRARCGRGTRTETTKTTLAAIMNRHPRSIQRYLADLIRFGYITTKTRRGEGGLYSGLIVSITEAVTPFYAKAKKLAGWLAETADIIAPSLPLPCGVPDRTGLPPKNDPYKDSSYVRRRRAA